MNFEAIRPYYDSEVNKALIDCINDPMMLALLDYTFPEKDVDFYKLKLNEVHSIYDFHKNIIYPALKRVLEETTESLTTSGFDDLDKNTSYLYISNHRDIVLDTSLTNLILLEKEMRMTASAIGDNLVNNDFLLTFSRVNRNFLVHRSLPPREMLAKAKELSSYIHYLLNNKNSIWLAQREGRTKDGNDTTHPGVIKMLSMAKPEDVHICDYLLSLKIIPLSISYEYDPTDYMKMPAILAALNGKKYTKTKNEDFNNILKGVLGYKKRVHISCGKEQKEFITDLKKQGLPDKAVVRAFAQRLTDEVQKNYKLHSTNYIAYDIINNSRVNNDKYTNEEYNAFLKRMDKKLENNEAQMRNNFLLMYANPVVNKINLLAHA
jgi:hypothetical protein